MEADLRRLSAFYLGCIQEEGLRRLTLKGGRRGNAFIVPSLPEERFLHEGLEVLDLSGLQSTHVSFLEEAEEERGPQTGGGDRLFYGFPIRVAQSGKIAPLFFAEVGAESTGQGEFRLNARQAGREYVNHHLFREEGYPPEQIIDLQEKLEQGGSYPKRLGRALAHLEGGGRGRDWRSTEELPRRPDPGLWASPIVFESTYSSYTYNLEKDLGGLQKYDFLREAAPETALGPLFRAGLGSRQETGGEPAEVLPLNEKQEEAACRARQEPLSAVTGPPGTGKSQVVVDLLAGAALSGRPVLFASKNNKAVDVVRDRLRSILGEKLDFTLRLGARSKMEEMEEEMGDRFQRLDQKQAELEEKLSEERRDALFREAEKTRRKIEALRQRRDAYQEAKKRREDAAEEVPSEWTGSEPPGSPEAIPISDLQRLLDRTRMLAGEDQCGALLWLKWAIFGDRLLRDLREETVGLTSGLPRAVGEGVYAQAHSAEEYGGVARTLESLKAYRTWIRRKAEEDEAHRRLGEALQGEGSYDERFQSLKESLSDTYRELLPVAWGGRIARNLSDVRRRFRRYMRAVEEVRGASPSNYREALDRLESATEALAEYLPVWIVTNLSARNALPMRPGLFDLAVIDEASQCDVASAIPLLFRARRSVIIGDPNQLRHITNLQEEGEEALARKSGAEALRPEWSYAERSLYDRAEGALSEQGGAPVLLRRHYRSHPAIIEFSNRRFYQGQLQPIREPEGFLVPEKWRGVRWLDVEGEVPSGISSAYNGREIQGVIRLLGVWEEEGLLGREDLSVGVVTPFRAQEERIREEARRQSWWQELREELGTSPATIGTIHRYQGDERDLMIFSPVVAPGMSEFTEQWVATTDQLLNVAITRARASLQVVGHLGRCRRAGGDLEAFADYVSSRAVIS